MEQAVLSLDDVTVGIGPRPILSHVSMQLNAGGWYGLVGQNGCGKTTLMRAALGLIRPLAGSVHACSTTPPYPAGWVSASFGPRMFHPRRRAHTELWLRITALGGGRSDLEAAWAETALADRQACCGDLSLGEAQRLAVVAALVNQPRLLVLDEPTVGLDLASLQWLRVRLRAYVGAGGCVWFSSHDLHEIELSADEIAVLSGGSLVYAGPVAALVGDHSATVRLRSSQPALLHEVIEASGYPFVAGEARDITVYDCDVAAVGRLLAARLVPLLSMVTPQIGLDSALHDLYTATGIGPALVGGER